MITPTIIYGARKSGKTLRAIQLSAETKKYILCSSKDRAIQIAKMAHDMGYKIPFPIFYGERFYSKGIEDIIVDDAIALLTRILCAEGYPGVRAMTVRITEEDEFIEVNEKA